MGKPFNPDRVQLDHILVVDIEATCWNGPPPPGQVSDVIEIGVCPIEVSTLTRLEKRSILVRPERSTVSEFCTSLTTLTPLHVEAAGVSFDEACQVLVSEYRSRNRAWASFGDYDRKQIQRQCDETGVRYPFGPRHINVKTLFALTRGMIYEVGTAQAVQMCGRTMEGTHHRGADDAWNIAGVLVDVLKAARS